MAFVSQYEIDMQKQKRMDQGLGMALEGYQGIEENRRRALELKRAQDKDAAAQELYQMKLKNEAMKSEKLGYGLDQLKKPVQERDDYIKAIDSGKVRNEMYVDRFDRQEKARQNAEQRKIENEKKQGLQQAAIPDFEIANPDIIPSSKDAEEVKKLNAANKTFVDVGQRAAEKLTALDPEKPVEFAKGYKQLMQDVTEMRLQAKELANLGVLNGPDLKLVDETLGSVGLTDMAIYGREEAAKRIQNAISTANQKLSNVAAARNYKPKGQSQAPQKDPEDDAALNWAKANPNDPRAKQILQLQGAN
jgi:hypothetical protein